MRVAARAIDSKTLAIVFSTAERHDRSCPDPDRSPDEREDGSEAVGGTGSR
jgi:hypothetical protein